MDSYLIGLLGVLLLFFLLAIGTHIGIALAVSGFVGIYLVTGFQQAIKLCVTAFYHKISGPVLIILPLFILMGYLARAIPERLGDCDGLRLHGLRHSL